MSRSRIRSSGLAFALCVSSVLGCEQLYPAPEMREVQLAELADSVGMQVIALGRSVATTKDALISSVRVDLGRPPPDIAKEGWCPLFSTLQATLEGHPMEPRWLGDREFASPRHPGWCIWPSFKINVIELRDELSDLDQLTIEVFDSSHRIQLVSGNFIRPVTFSLLEPTAGQARAGDTLWIGIDPPTAVPPRSTLSFTQTVVNDEGRLEDYYPLGVQDLRFLEPNVFQVFVPNDAVLASDFPAEEGYRWLFEAPSDSGYAVPNGWSVEVERCDAPLGCVISRNDCGPLAQRDHPCAVGDWSGSLDSPFVDLRVVP